MAFKKKTAPEGGYLSNEYLLPGGTLSSKYSSLNPDCKAALQEKTPTARQAERLSRRFIMSPPLAIVVAGLAYGEASR